MDSHDHCFSCVSPSTCSSITACSTISCPDCSVSMHECKLEDHSIICWEKSVPCINVNYGCPNQIIRRFMCDHLAICPAIVPQKVPYDITSCEHCSMIMPTTDLADHHLVCDDLPVPCTNATFGCPVIMKRKEVGVHLGHCPASITQCLYMYSRCSEDGEVLITKNKESQLADERNFLRDQADFSEFSLSLIPSRAGTYYPSISDANAIEALQRGQRIFFSGCFVCGGFIRRDQFSSHWLSHIETIDDLPLKIRRCPLMKYGCQHGTVVSQPVEGTLQYKDDFRALVICPSVGVSPSSEGDSSSYATEIAKKQELSLYGYGGEEDGSLDVLGQLPIEVLLRILSHVDSLSLWSLSQVNHYLRNICEELLSSHGIVYMLWEKEVSQFQICFTNNVCINL